MKFLTLGLLLGLTACNEVMAPAEPTEPTTTAVTPRVTAEIEVPDSVWRRAEAEILSEITSRGWHFVRVHHCFEEMSWFSQWVGSGYMESVEAAVTSWEETQSEGDPDYVCIITDH